MLVPFEYWMVGNILLHENFHSCLFMAVHISTVESPMSNRWKSLLTVSGLAFLMNLFTQLVTQLPCRRFMLIAKVDSHPMPYIFREETF